MRPLTNRLKQITPVSGPLFPIERLCTDARSTFDRKSTIVPEKLVCHSRVRLTLPIRLDAIVAPVHPGGSFGWKRRVPGPTSSLFFPQTRLAYPFSPRGRG